MSAILETHELSKSYQGRLALQNLSLRVNEGDIFGFVGPNGAGKTTAIRIICTLLAPDSGDARVLGHSIRTAGRQVRQAIGYMPDFFGVYPDMKVWEYLDFFGACYQLPAAQRTPVIRDLLDLVDLSHRSDDLVQDLSRGMKQRLSLARTLIHDPAVLILDEPASGLDPRARVEIRELMRELARLGKTIFFSTHILADVAEICSKIAIIEAGRLVAVGKLDELQRQLAPHRRIEMTILGQPDPAVAVLRELPNVEAIEVDGVPGSAARGRLWFYHTGDEASVSQLLAILVSAGIPIIEFREESGDLEDVFLQLTEGLVT